MCVECLVELCPDRAATCLEEGTYLHNYKGCKQCGLRDMLIARDRKHVAQEGELDEFEETIEFEHSCPNCSHVVSTHFYSFAVSLQEQTNELVQDYQMQCHLCGKGTHVVKVVPTVESNLSTAAKARDPKTPNQDALFASLRMGPVVSTSHVAAAENDAVDESEW
eukprot:GILK01008921.1.p1 GENE.GILK01008921.1~~GILK01008921.1.p1  ORF type:complete len:165 (-),score=22.51 GILK01008921.1:220-714(-)